MRTVLLPVKDFRQAKQRLASTLEPRQRAELARAMLMDVLRAISRARRPERIVVFTASAAVADIARLFNFEIVQEAAVRGHSAAVNQMVDDLAATASHILSIAADLPALTPREIDDVFDTELPDIGLVASRDGTGTNAALFVSPARIQMQYGEGSLRRHISSAAAAGFHPNVLRVPGMEFDLDTPDDLTAFVRQGPSETETWHFLMTLTKP